MSIRHGKLVESEGISLPDGQVIRFLPHDWKTGKLLTLSRGLHPRADVDRPYLS